MEGSRDRCNKPMGKVGHFYVEELEDCPELLFFKGVYSQMGFVHTWIDVIVPSFCLRT